MQAIAGYRLPMPTSLLLLEVNPSDNRRRHSQDGDEALLRAVAKVAQRNLRTTDLIFRHGPNELLILLLKTDLHEATSIGIRIQHDASDEKLTAVIHVKAALIAPSEPDKPVLETIYQTIANARDRRSDDSNSKPPRGSIH
jgi:diguanylate cyclase (GGDEF)-like protein